MKSNRTITLELNINDGHYLTLAQILECLDVPNLEQGFPDYVNLSISIR
jgi:hypothetical protein